MIRNEFLGGAWLSSQEESKVYRESIEEYLRRGGKITKCPPKSAQRMIEGSLVLDGETFSVIPAGAEAVPQMNRVSLAQYDKGLEEAIRPPHHLAWRDIERETAPTVVRKLWDGRSVDADEIDYVEQQA